MPGPSTRQAPPMAAIHAPSSRRRTSAAAGPRHHNQAVSTPETAPSDTTREVVSLARVTQVTQLSSLSLRARARRPSNESSVTYVTSKLSSDTSDTTLELSAPLRAYAPAATINETHVTPVTGSRS